MGTDQLLQRRSAGSFGSSDQARRAPVDAATLAAAAVIVERVRDGGEAALRAVAAELGDVESVESPLFLSADELQSALNQIDHETRALLEARADSIRAFAEAQRDSIDAFSMPIEGGSLDQEVAPVERAGCYAPGGRYPLPSSVLMTAVTARAAGVDEVWVASPKPTAVTMAAAAIAGVDGLLACGGAHAIAALTHGVGPIAPSDAIVGPGNRWVTAAKQLVSGIVRIDMLAGPSEVLVIADETADAAIVAADLLAQAEHDADASAILVTTSSVLADAVDEEVGRQLGSLATAATAREALQNSCTCVVASMEEAIRVADLVAPEHLEVMTADSEAVARQLRHWGGLFVGMGAAEVVGDYGLGPNHTLPTGGTARSYGGLSVFDFLRIRTAIRLGHRETPRAVYEETATFARLEGLEGHARAAEARIRSESRDPA